MLATQQILSRIDYCNTLYLGLPKYLQKKLQLVINKTAKMIVYAGYRERASPILINLHWLPLIARIEYKVCCLVHSALHTGFPAYLREKLQLLQYPNVVGTRNSNDTLKLFEPRVEGSYGDRSFTYKAPRIFNKLPRSLREIVAPDLFKKKLKTFFFSRAFDLQDQTTNPDYKL